MDTFSQNDPPSVGLSAAGALSLGDRSLSSLTASERGEARHRMILGQPVLPWATGTFSPGPKQQCRSTSSDLDIDLRDDRMGPLKLARIDCQQQREPDFRATSFSGSFVRSNSILSDGSWGCSPTFSTTSDASLLAHESSFMPDRRLMRSDSILSCPDLSSCRGMPSHHEAYPYRLSGFLLPTSRDNLINHFVSQSHSPFTATQLRELQHQALIFKYLRSGLNVPMELLLPLRNSFLELSNMVTGAHQLANIGWGNYHVGSGNMDPEPGRCRRTDGKKWRCSRDVVPEQKYCERHMHRGRHRAKRNAENNQSNSSTQPVAHSSSSASSVTVAAPPGTALSNSLRPAIADLNTQQNKLSSTLALKSFASTNSPTPADAVTMGSSIGVSQFPLPFQSTMKDNRYFSGVPKPDIELGPEQMFSEALSWQNSLNSSKQQNSFAGTRYGAKMEEVNVDRESEGQQLRHFFDDWPRSRATTRAGALSWQQMEADQQLNPSSSATKLSISPHMGASEFGSASRPSSSRGKLSLSSLNLSMARVGDDEALSVDELTQMGLRVSMHEDHRSQNNWNPITWESAASVGGPLGEVLQSTNTTPRHCKSSDLNLMCDGWDHSPRHSPPMASPPHAVSQHPLFQQH